MSYVNLRVHLIDWSVLCQPILTVLQRGTDCYQINPEKLDPLARDSWLVVEQKQFERVLGAFSACEAG